MIAVRYAVNQVGGSARGCWRFCHTGFAPGPQIAMREGTGQGWESEPREGLRVLARLVLLTAAVTQDPAAPSSASIGCKPAYPAIARNQGCCVSGR